MSIVRLDTLRTLAFGGISGTYAVVGTPIQHNWRVVHFVNNTDGDVIFSADGINDNVFVPAGSFALYDIAANSPSSTGFVELVFALFTQFYVKQSTAPTKGAVYIMGIYARNE